MKHCVFAHPWIDRHEIDLRQAITDEFRLNRSLALKVQSVGLNKVTDLDKYACQLAVARQLNELNQKRFILTLPLLVESLNTLKLLGLIFKEAEWSTKIDQFERKWLTPFLVLLNSLTKISTLINHVMDLQKLQEARLDPTTIILNPTLVPSVAQAVKNTDQIHADIEQLRSDVETELTGSSKGRIKIVPHLTLGRIFRAPKAVQVPDKVKISHKHHPDIHTHML